MNLDEVVALALCYTSLSIEVVTIKCMNPSGPKQPFSERSIRSSLSMEVIANLIFMNSERAGVFEVLSVVRDRRFSNNARDAEFLSYTISTGHTPFPAPATWIVLMLNGSEII